MAAARAMLPPSNWMMRLGRTGAMTPKARKSKSTVTRMKTKAARLAWGCGVGGAALGKAGSYGTKIVAGNQKPRHCKQIGEHEIAIGCRSYGESDVVNCKNVTRQSQNALELRPGSDFEDDGKNQGPLGSLLADVALQVHADFFLDDAPVGFFFGVGFFYGLQNDEPRASDEFLAVVAHQAARHDFRMRFHLARVFVDRDDRHDDPVFGKMFSIPDYDVFDFFERTGIHADASCSHGIAPERAVFREFNRLAVFDEQNFSGHHAQLMREGGVAEKMPKLAVDGNEIFRLHQLQQEFLFFLARVTGNVDNSRGIIVINQRAPPEHMVQHAENGFFISWNDARGENDAVVFVHGDEAMIVHRDARQRRHRLGLRSAGENDDALRIEPANVLLAHHHSVGNAQQFQRVRNLDVIDHAAADEGNFAIYARSNVNDLLNSVNGGSEARENYAPRRRAAQLFDARNDRAFRRREARTLHVRGIAEEREHAFVAVLCERVKVKRRAADGRLVNLEIARVNDYAERRADRQRNAVHRAVRHGNKFNLERANLHEPAGNHFAQRGGFQQSRFIQAFFHQRQREPRPIHGNIEVAQNIRQRADVIFMAVRQHDRAYMSTILLQIRSVRYDQVDAEQFRFRKHHARIDDEDVVAEPQRHHVHAEFAETAERNGREGLRGLAQ